MPWANTTMTSKNQEKNLRNQEKICEINEKRSAPKTMQNVFIRRFLTILAWPRGFSGMRVFFTHLVPWHGWMGHDSDIHLLHVPGHEFAGVVAAVGGVRAGGAVSFLFCRRHRLAARN